MMWYDNKYKGVNMCGELKKARKKKKEKRKKGEINYRDKERKKRDIAWP